MRKNRFLLLILFVFMVTSIKANDYKYHQFFLYTFIKHTKWPSENSNGPRTIGVLGEHSILADLKKMSKVKTIDSKRIKIERYKKVKNIKDCHVLFIPFEQSSLIEDVILKIQKNNFPTLIVTEKPEMLKKGSMINFLKINGKTYFEINRKRALDSQIEISLQLDKFTIK